MVFSPITVAAFNMFIAAVFNALSTAVTWCYTKVEQLVVQITSIDYKGLINNLVSFLFGGFALVRWFAFAMLVITFLLVNDSKFCDSLSSRKRWIMRSVLVAPAILVVPLCPRPWKIKNFLEMSEDVCEKPWFRSFFYDVVKGLGIMLCFWGSNELGEFINILSDSRMVHASLSFLLFLFALDLLYDFEETLEVRDSYLLAGYGLMIKKGQTIIPLLTVHLTCGFLCVLKTYLRSKYQTFPIQDRESRGRRSDAPEYQSRSVEFFWKVGCSWSTFGGLSGDLDGMGCLEGELKSEQI